MSRASGLLVVLLTTAACGAESWSFDHEADAGDAEGPGLEDAGAGEEGSPSTQDGALESAAIEASVPETGPASDASPALEAGPGCSADGDCLASPGLPFCDRLVGRCVQCVDGDDCGLESICDLRSHTCTKTF